MRHLVWWPLSYAARGAIERYFAVAKRYCRLGCHHAIGYPAVTQRVTLTFGAILVVALAAQRAGQPHLRLSPTRVLAHYLPVEDRPCLMQQSLQGDTSGRLFRTRGGVQCGPREDPEIRPRTPLTGRTYTC